MDSNPQRDQMLMLAINYPMFCTTLIWAYTSHGNTPMAEGLREIARRQRPDNILPFERR